MKIALPTRQNQIDDHFGHCEYFTVFTIENKEMVAEEIVTSPEGCGCKSNIAEQLGQMNVTVMLAGNMGEGAVNVLNRSGIKVIRGCSGNVKEVALAYINGTLVDSGVACAQHEHGCH